MKKPGRTIFAATAAAVALLAGSAPALAGQPATSSTEEATSVSGLVTNMNAGLLTLRTTDGRSQAVNTSNAAVEQGVAVGKNAKATGEIRSDNTLMANTVRVATAPIQ